MKIARLLTIVIIAECPLVLGAEQSAWQYFELDQLAEENRASAGNYHRFLDRASFSMGLYSLRAGAEDNQSPHERDEVYYIVRGDASLEAGDDTIDIRPGRIVFVRAGVPHRFVNIRSDLQVLVVFSKTTSSTNDPEWLAFDADELAGQRQTGENVWNLFLESSTMNMGLYMLPKALGGDRTLTHGVDEINIVVDGRSTFIVGNDEMKVGPGSIFYVQEGNGHNFEDLQSEFIDILILFHQK